MALTKQTFNLNFSQGLDTKTDPYQVSFGKFLKLENSVFVKGGLLNKRNGFAKLASLPNTASNFVTTFNGDLTAVGTNLEAYSASSMSWYSKGALQPIGLSTLPLIRNNTTQSQADSAVAPNGFICTVYTSQDPSNLSNPIYYYVVADSVTGQNIIAPTVITNAFTGFGTPKVWIIGNNFIVVYTAKTGATYRLEFIAISTANPTVVSAPVIITSSYTPATTLNFDAAVLNGSLYVAWNGASSSGIKVAYINSSLIVSVAVNPDSAHVATLMSVSADQTDSSIWVTYYNSGTQNAYTVHIDTHLGVLLGAHLILGSVDINNLSSFAMNGVLTFLYEVTNLYSYDFTIPTHYVGRNTINSSATLGTPINILRSVGLASKIFLYNGTLYSLFVYQSPYQSTYFLASTSGNIIAKFAYGNAQGYLLTGLPNWSTSGDVAFVSYLYKDLIQAVNKNTNIPAGNQTAGIYSQLGINLAQFDFSKSANGVEIGSNLNLTGGFVWAYDGYLPNEQGFFLWPDSIEATWSTSGGSIVAKPDSTTNTNAYYYQVTYEWTDNQGNAFKSAPSIPLPVTTTGSGTSGSITLHIPTLRLTYKVANPVKIVIYRWSVAQQVYYQVTSIATPLLNSLSSDQVQFVDTFADSSVLGNSVLYTTGGVIENIGAPAVDEVFIFDDRLWGIVAEDKNLLWYSKTVLEATPVELSDLFTYYVAPNVGAQGSTGPIKAGCAMDDKLIIFKASAINYIAGTGPDNTGSNDQYTQPIFVTAVVGCSNQKSIVFQPNGLMFEFASQGGNQIWLLSRDLSTQFIGASVSALTQNATVESAVNIPGTNQVRFTMSSGITLMYDYFYGQWASFVNIPAISSTVFQGVHTFIDQFGQVFKETPGVYLDGGSPVLMAFDTSWINLAGLQGYQRAYEFTLLGTYYSPHFLNLQIAYDYSPTTTGDVNIFPNNYGNRYGIDTPYGQGDPYGGPLSVESWRIFFSQQRCESFQIKFQEYYDQNFRIDQSFQDPPGQGLSLSGMALVLGLKKGFKPFSSSNSGGIS